MSEHTSCHARLVLVAEVLGEGEDAEGAVAELGGDGGAGLLVEPEVAALEQHAQRLLERAVGLHPPRLLRGECLERSRSRDGGSGGPLRGEGSCLGALWHLSGKDPVYERGYGS